MLEKLLKYEYYSMILFAIASFIAVKAGNVFLGIGAVLFFIYAYKNKIKLPVSYKNYFFVIGLFVFTMLLSALFSGDIVKGLKVWINMWVYRFMPFFIILICCKDYLKAKRILTAAVIGFVIAVMVLIYQWSCGVNRPAGLFDWPMTFGGFLCMYLPMLMIIMLDKNFEFRYRVVSGVIFSLGFVGLVLSGTRGAWVALAPVLLGILFYYMLKNKKVLVIGLAVICVTSIALSSYQPFVNRAHSITDSKNTSNSERWLLWESSYNMFKDHPVLGVGLGQYKKAYQEQYILPEALQPSLQHAHSNFMQMLGENGIIGFMGFITMIGYIIFENLKKFYCRKNLYSLAIASSTIALMLYGLTDYNFGDPNIVKGYWLLTGCLLVLSEQWSKAD